MKNFLVGVYKIGRKMITNQNAQLVIIKISFLNTLLLASSMSLYIKVMELIPRNKSIILSTKSYLYSIFSGSYQGIIGRNIRLISTDEIFIIGSILVSIIILMAISYYKVEMGSITVKTSKKNTVFSYWALSSLLILFIFLISSVYTMPKLLKGYPLDKETLKYILTVLLISIYLGLVYINLSGSKFIKAFIPAVLASVVIMFMMKYFAICMKYIFTKYTLYGIITFPVSSLLFLYLAWLVVFIGLEATKIVKI